jgi:hypothetical protein
MNGIDHTERGTPVISRDGHLTGRLTGGSRRCRLEECRGTCLGVRWPDRRLTWPCLRGLRWDETLKAWRVV